MFAEKIGEKGEDFDSSYLGRKEERKKEEEKNN
jgi:hypothetical protein